MRNPDYKYVDTAINGANNRNKVVDVTRLKIPPGAQDCYRTIFRFQDDFKKHVASSGSVKGYRGSAYADYLPFDIDDNDLEKSLERARQILDRLESLYDVELSQLLCYFSGSKGFHILIPEPMIGLYASSKLPQVFKEMAKEVLQGVTFDGSIYEHMRLFRISNTRNSKSGLFKVPLTAGEILYQSIDDIKKMAQGPRKIETCPYDEIDQNEALNELFVNCIRRINSEEQKDILAPTVNHIPKDSKLCYYNLLNGVGEGERDNAAIRLATHFRKQGYQADITLGVLQAWNRRNNPPLHQADVEKFIYQAYENNYDYGCKDFLLEQYCDTKCYLRKRKEVRVSEDKIYSIHDARKKYEEYVSELDKRKIKLGIDVLDKRLRGVAPGEVLQLMARSSVGKTAIALNVIKHVNKNSPVLFFSLEMPAAQIFERNVQIAGGYEGEFVENSFKSRAPDMKIMTELTEKEYGNTYIVDQDFLTLDELKEYTELAEKKIGQRIDLLVVDYLGRMKGVHGSEYEVISELAKQLKNLAKETDKAVICLHQTNRAGGTGAEPITMDMGRGSGVFEEAADHIVGAWRPDIDTPEAQRSDTEKIVLAVLKGRKGPKCQHEMCLHKKRLQIVEWDMLQDAKSVKINQSELPFKEGMNGGN